MNDWRECQIPCLQLIAEGNADPVPESPLRRLKLALRRHLSPDRERAVKASTNRLLNAVSQVSGTIQERPRVAAAVGRGNLKPGDFVRVRSQTEIEATLNHWGQLRGCTFMREMQPYCNTVRRVLRSMERFVDERDLRAKRAHGIVLLEGVNCLGTAEFGRCDRNCFLFWREEWLEKVDGEPLGTETGPSEN